jgi:diamine N-acetyltransferase
MMNEMVNITLVQKHEITQLCEISKLTFTSAFAHHNTVENMQLYFEHNLNIASLTAEFENKNAQFYFAKINNEIVGYLKLNFSNKSINDANQNTIEIERIYIHPQHQGKKIGQQLLQFTINLAQEKSLQIIWLGVWEHNTGAIKFYANNGFKPFDKHIFMLGNDPQTDILMYLEIKNN